MLNKLKKRIDSFKSEYMERSPRGKWRFVRDIGNSILSLAGIPFLNPHFENYWYSYSGAVLSAVFFISFGYSYWFYMDRDRMQIALITPLFGLMILVNNFCP